MTYTEKINYVLEFANKAEAIRSDEYVDTLLELDHKHLETLESCEATLFELDRAKDDSTIFIMNDEDDIVLEEIKDVEEDDDFYELYNLILDYIIHKIE